MISLCHNFPHRSFGAATANDAVAYISNSICAPAKTKIKTNLAKNKHHRQIAAHTTSNSFAAKRAVSLCLSLSIAPPIRYPVLFRSGILKNANINLTFNRLLSWHGAQRHECGVCSTHKTCAIVQLYNDMENMLHVVVIYLLLRS